MVASILLFILFIFISTSLLFFMFCFFIPALSMITSGEIRVFSGIKPAEAKSGTDAKAPIDLTKQAYIEQAAFDKTGQLHFHGPKSCAIFYAAYTAGSATTQNCIGYGDCMNVCPQKAIFSDGEKLVISDLCTGCGKCTQVCPISLISLVPVTEEHSCATVSKKRFKFWYYWYKLLDKGIRRS